MKALVHAYSIPVQSIQVRKEFGRSLKVQDTPTCLDKSPECVSKSVQKMDSYPVHVGNFDGYG